VSDSEAFDLVLTDVLPSDLTYIPNTLVSTGGLAPTALDDLAAPTLIVRWDAFPLGAMSVIQFQATLGPIAPGEEVANEAALVWTSLPDDNASVPFFFSPYNALSTERVFDPGSLVDIYQVVASASVSAPALPATGFAPGQTTALRPQALADLYQDLGGLWLEIPSLGVSSRIVGVPMGARGWDLTWLWDSVGYLEGTAYPSLPGNTALTAHAYLANGLPGPFAELGQLSWGQRLFLHANGQLYVYEIRQVRRVFPENLSVLQHEDYAWLTLITCEGFDERLDGYLRRVVVRAVLVEVTDDR
jgi:LPXTG-site transpeptidase (sortase) family protein